MTRFTAVAAIILLTATAAAQGPDPVRLRHTVDGYQVELVVETPLDPSIAKSARGTEYRQRVTLTVLEPKIGRRVQLAAATLSVAERGHTGPTYELHAVQSAEGPAYEARVTMAVQATYRMVVRATPQGASQALTTDFDYRYPH